ncbi:hypothetical protein Sjap_018292 [Stephania japonica]|uniref:DSP-PTPase phosphatase fused to NAD+ Kinase domain-containing protein n=1 Tax=Stephania japonica TaxID=461633 RepID=A0AAP0I7T4_9MAGN
MDWFLADDNTLLGFRRSELELVLVVSPVSSTPRLAWNLSEVVMSSALSLHDTLYGYPTQLFTFQSQDLSQLSWIGPVPGDIAEVEAYCRIFRSAEHLHTAIMDTLCNPLTGECFVSYDTPSEDVESLEEKVVVVLGCLVSLLNKGREEVLSGRSSFMKSFKTVEVDFLDDKLPPLAAFRREMKRCCESLHIALENYLTPSDSRSTEIWRKLQRLKNVCYDAGFSRGEHGPCPTLFANWTPVYFSNETEDLGEVAFWRGGQVTDEGLKWLMQKGYRTIVDLRAEIVKDEFYRLAVDNAVSCGRIEVLRLPVEVGTAPSMEQVEKFASLVSNSKKTPIYLHSQEGVWRTSAMVSRWRQYIARHESLTVSILPPKIGEYLSENQRDRESCISSRQHGDAFSKDKNGSPIENLDSTTGSNGKFHSEVSSTLENGANKGILAPRDTALEKSSDGVEVGSPTNSYSEIKPLLSQLPTCNIFSRREMSTFFKDRKVTPTKFLNHSWKRLETSISRDRNKGTAQNKKPHSGASVPGLLEEKSSNGLFKEKHILSESPAYYSSNGKFLKDGSRGSFGLVADGAEGKMHSGTETKITSSVKDTLGKSLICSAVKVPNDNGRASLASIDNDTDVVEGDMCASATGVVRLQSRRKAEMFLVRTDGFSCSREKVTESSLAFTHPSTQQQMLMWKSPPKTVLLLKKLGTELMEEAKEVASFLYHQEKMNVLVEPDVHDIFARIPGFGFIQTFYSQDTSDLHDRVDFVACLGGDGVILHASNLFRGAVPPVVSFNLGSLGFLTSHTFEDYRQDLRQIIHGNDTADGVYITLRMRLRCEVFRNGKAMPGKIFDILNEIVVDRGSNPYLSKIETYEHNRLITKVQGDGVIVATPTGSTAYSTAAGGCHVMFDYEFRPVILPDSAQLELKIPEDARSNAWVSFDGKRRQQLSRGDSIKICMSKHPLPTVNKFDQTGDWFRSLIRCLNWNERLDQKAL